MGVHLVSHLIARVWRRSLENLRIVIVQPHQPVITVERLDPGTHPLAEIAMAVGVNFNFVILS